MKAIKFMQDKKGAILTVGIIVLSMAVVIFSGLLASCSGQADAESVDGDLVMTDIAEEATDASDDTASAEEMEGEEELAELGDHETDAPLASEISTGSDTGASIARSSVEQPASTSHPSNTAPSTGSSSQKKWVEDTQRVWVEDKAAWSEQVPIYSNKEVSICNVCGSDITGNTSAHGKAHMLAGEGSGHHSEVRQTVTGYNTVSHPAEGHYENKVVGGHWE